jgi:hypothetical protein
MLDRRRQADLKGTARLCGSGATLLLRRSVQLRLRRPREMLEKSYSPARSATGPPGESLARQDIG